MDTFQVRASSSPLSCRAGNKFRDSLEEVFTFLISHLFQRGQIMLMSFS